MGGTAEYMRQCQAAGPCPLASTAARPAPASVSRSQIHPSCRLHASSLKKILSERKLLVQDGNTVVIESATILRYLCETHGVAEPWYPGEWAELGRMF